MCGVDGANGAAGTCGRLVDQRRQEDPRPPGSRHGPTYVGGAAASGSPGRSFCTRLHEPANLDVSAAQGSSARADITPTSPDATAAPVAPENMTAARRSSSATCAGAGAHQLGRRGPAPGWHLTSRPAQMSMAYGGTQGKDSAPLNASVRFEWGFGDLGSPLSSAPASVAQVVVV